MNETSQRVISASLLRLRMKSPFFATLALFARFVPTQQVFTAATDGKNIYFNLEYLLSLPPSQQDGLLLHEVLHAALLHVFRRGAREAQLWNIAADIVVNGAIAAQGCFELPPGGIKEPKLEHLSAEEIYELLEKDGSGSLCLTNPDLLSEAPQGTKDAETSANESDSKENGNKDSSSQTSQPSLNENKDSLSQAKQAELEAHWRNAIQQATVIARTLTQGLLPLGMERELGALTEAQLDWRNYLWRYLVKTPTDFSNFDRRFIGRKLYLETLEGESVQVYVAVDTSGSIDNKQLRMFLSEVAGILNAYPHLKCELYYADAQAYGPYPLDPNSYLPQPEGGGGTSFVPFFARVRENWDGLTQGVCVYLTDGYGTFPDLVPELAVLWVVTPGGLALSEFPFGEAVRLLSV
jgi:predicted metal-dependent peptidase